jgi:transcription elongation factor Elf1
MIFPRRKCPVCGSVKVRKAPAYYAGFLRCKSCGLIVPQGVRN